MGLKDLTLPTETVELPGGKVSLRGLSVNDIQVMFIQNADTMTNLFNELVNTPSDPTDMLSGDVASRLLTKAPDMVAQIIAVSAGEPDEVEKVKMLPAPLQLEMLEKVGNLTFCMEGGVKKTLETVIRMFQATNRNLMEIRA